MRFAYDYFFLDCLELPRERWELALLSLEFDNFLESEQLESNDRLSYRLEYRLFCEFMRW